MTESPLDIAVLIDDHEMIRLVSVWPKLTPQQRQNESDIARASAISVNRVTDIIFRAKVSNLIRDDGTINSNAEKYISGIIGARLSEHMSKVNKVKAKPNAG